MKADLTYIFAVCENEIAFMKACRRVLKLSQKKMAVRLWTYQCYISHFENGCCVKPGEEDRILHNLHCELEEICENLTENHKIIFFINILCEYFSQMESKFNKNFTNRDDVCRILLHFSKKLGKIC